MAKLLIESPKGDSLGNVEWIGTRFVVVADSEAVRDTLEGVIAELSRVPTGLVSGGVRDGKFVTTREYVRAEGAEGLAVIADVILRRRVRSGGTRLIPRYQP